ncbi:type IV fimbrial assembly, ATPase PilB [Bacillus sp. JCM 19046]|nr:type IV fimbrial assembly, ATPase PilB [Bacillus sp. JCM 19045]GAF16619.1 type IV fimbrial assembly, ATPase PilB [Bacillus sp. JCM 19046]
MTDIERTSKDLINEAILLGATDIHFMPLKNGYQCRYRVAGSLTRGSFYQQDIAEKIINYLKYIVGMDIGERRKSQSKSMLYTHQSTSFTLRFSTLPASPTESLAIRIAPFTSPYLLQSLSFFQADQSHLSRISLLNEGLVLITGATGSGKTTTIYALLEEFKKRDKAIIISIEDPVERPLEGIIQMEVNEKAGITFTHALQAILRHDPDIIVIGEIRDEQTAVLAIQAAMTGHLVLASLHATNAFLSFMRLKELGVTNGFDCIKAVVHQKLAVIKGTTMRFSVYDWLVGDDLVQAIKGVKPKRSNCTSLKRAWAIKAIDSEECLRLL